MLGLSAYEDFGFRVLGAGDWGSRFYDSRFWVGGCNLSVKEPLTLHPKPFGFKFGKLETQTLHPKTVQV